MGKYALVWEGEVHDYRFKLLQENWHYAFYCGDIYMGQVFNLGRAGWSAVPKVPTGFTYDGFKTRRAAAEMILKVNGYRSC